MRWASRLSHMSSIRLVQLDTESNVIHTFACSCCKPATHIPQPKGHKRNAVRFRLDPLCGHIHSNAFRSSRTCYFIPCASDLNCQTHIQTNLSERLQESSRIHTHRFRLSANMQMGSAWFLAGPARNTLTCTTVQESSHCSDRSVVIRHTHESRPWRVENIAVSFSHACSDWTRTRTFHLSVCTDGPNLSFPLCLALMHIRPCPHSPLLSKFRCSANVGNSSKVGFYYWSKTV